MRGRTRRFGSIVLLGALLTAGPVRVPGGESTPPPAGDPSAWVDARVREWQPSAAERRFDEIGWARDIRHARRLSEESGRPVFLFTHDGRMATGRC
jgi:hypothetical protein